MTGSRSSPVILTYHSISEGRSPLCTSPGLFAWQMEWLKAGGHHVIPLAELASAVRGDQVFPPRSIVLTFDDGFRDFHEAAFPVLRRCGFPSTVFLVTGYCGRANRWPRQPAGVPERPLLGWEEVRQLARQGVKFGAHGDTHADLTRLPPEAVEREVLTSKKDLGAQLGEPVEFFCYPYGQYNHPARSIVFRHFRGACTTDMGRVQPESDVFCLPRFDAFYLRSKAMFPRLFTRSGSVYFSLRAVLRAARARYGTLFADK